MRLFIAGLSLLTVLVTACSDDGGGEARIGSSSSAIIAGSLDTSRGAVVAILGTDPRRAICTGTLVAAAPAASTGWVLTSAHCVASARAVVSGTDFAAPSAVTLSIDARFTHPGFDPVAPSSSVDVGVLRVTGLVAGVQPIAVATQEIESLKVGVGLGVVYVGYGMRRPGTAASGNGPNTSRVSIAKTIVQAGGDRFESNYVSGGPCHGDEGGPALVTVGGRDALIATSWFMTLDCAGRAVSLRAHTFAPWLASLVASERTRLGAYGSADGVVASVGGVEDASAAVVPPDAAATSQSPSQAVGGNGQLAAVAPTDDAGAASASPGAPGYPGTEVSLPGTSGCAVSPPALSDAVAVWTGLGLAVALVTRRRRRMSR